MARHKLFTSTIVGTLVLGVLTITAVKAGAQQDGGDAGAQQNGGVVVQNGQPGDFPDFGAGIQNALNTFMAQQRDQNIKRQLNEAGFTDADLQAAVFAYLKDTAKLATTLRAKLAAITTGMRGDTKDAQFTTMLGDLRKAVADAKATRMAALATLDTKIGYTKQPRLAALLTQLGVVGEQSDFTKAMGAGGMGGVTIMATARTVVAGGPNANPAGGQMPKLPDFRTMTPEQLSTYMEQAREQNIKQQLDGAGFVDADLQAAIFAYLKDKTKIGNDLRAAFGAIGTDLHANATDAHFQTTLADLDKALADAKTANATALAEMDTKIGYTKLPRLEAFLTAIGIIGDEAAFVNALDGGITTPAMQGNPQNGPMIMMQQA